MQLIEFHSSEKRFKGNATMVVKVFLKNEVSQNDQNDFDHFCDVALMWR